MDDAELISPATGVWKKATAGRSGIGTRLGADAEEPAVSWKKDRAYGCGTPRRSRTGC